MLVSSSRDMWQAQILLLWMKSLLSTCCVLEISVLWVCVDAIVMSSLEGMDSATLHGNCVCNQRISKKVDKAACFTLLRIH